MVKNPFEMELINVIQEVVIEIRTKSVYLKKIHENLERVNAKMDRMNDLVERRFGTVDKTSL